MADEYLWKRPSEEIWFYHQFKRIPTPGWLKTGETIASINSIVIWNTTDGVDASSSMLLSSAIVEDTKVGYKVGAGTAGKSYETRIKITSSGGEKFEDHIRLEVISD